MDKKEIQNSENKKSQSKCNLIVMPQTITDDDISALFNGLIKIVRKKVMVIYTNIKMFV